MGYYDQMQACANGHLITDSARRNPALRADFCERCGASTIDACPSCGVAIKGEYVVEGIFTIVGGEVPVPPYCSGCGEPYPWQKAALENLTEIMREGDLSDSEIAEFEAVLPDIVSETPRSASAALKLRRLLGRLGKPIHDAAVRAVADVASDTARKVLGL